MGANNCRLLTMEILQNHLATIDTILFDCDGVLWRGKETLPGSTDLTQRLISLGKRVGYVTNNSSRTIEVLKNELNQRGFPTVEEDLVIGTSRTTALYLQKHRPGSNIYCIGNPAVVTELCKVGINAWMTEPEQTVKDMSVSSVDAVICALDRSFNYHRLAVGNHFLRTNKDCLFVATNLDPSYPEAGGMLYPGTGSLVSALSTASGRQPDIVIGKPYSLMFDLIAEQLGLDSKRTLMVGDRLDTDIGFASAIGGPSLFVLTGIDTLETAQSYAAEGSGHPEFAPTFYLPSVEDLDKMLEIVMKS